MKTDKIIKLLNKNKSPYAMTYSKFKEFDYLTGIQNLLQKGRLFDYLSKDSPGRRRMLLLQTLHKHDEYRKIFLDDVEHSQLHWDAGEGISIDDIIGYCGVVFNCIIPDKHRFSISHDDTNLHLSGVSSNVKGLTHKCLTYVKASMLIMQTLLDEPLKLIAHCSGIIHNNIGKPISQQQQVKYFQSKGFKIDYYSRDFNTYQLSFAFNDIDVVSDFLKSLNEEQQRFLIQSIKELRESSFDATSLN